MNLFKSPEAIIKAIHNEVDSAQERLLNEALAVINSGNKNIETIGERLRRVGFINTPTTLKANESIKQKAVSIEQANLIQ